MGGRIGWVASIPTNLKLGPLDDPLEFLANCRTVEEKRLSIEAA
jgi:hypothetical protein